jgi:hypothetical protein
MCQEPSFQPPGHLQSDGRMVALLNDRDIDYGCIGKGCGLTYVLFPVTQLFQRKLNPEEDPEESPTPAENDNPHSDHQDEGQPCE